MDGYSIQLNEQDILRVGYTTYMFGGAWRWELRIGVERHVRPGRIDMLPATSEHHRLAKADPRYAEMVAAAQADVVERQRECEEQRERMARIETAMRELAERCEREGAPGYYRYGKPPANGHSHNHRDNHAEEGISVYGGWELPDSTIVLDLRGCDATSGLFIRAGRALYRVQGDEIGTGSDGEPLLAVKRVEKLTGRHVESLL